MILQPVADIAEICARKGLRQVVLSPGSRCAPLTLAFNRHPDITVRTVSDERAAAFIALGMAITLREPVALVCTSGTAALNYAPAVAEAFFQQVPLLILTADRPPEWIDQQDGQTIRQQNIYGAHAKKSYSFPVDYSHPDARWHCARMVSEAINEATAFPAGPVQINVPLREPFYPAANETITFTQDIKIIEEEANTYKLSLQQQQNLQQELQQFERVMILAGQQQLDQENLAAVQQFAEATGAVVVGDVISNLHPLPQVMRLGDVFLSPKEQPVLKELQPDLLITFGKSTISKNLKLFLRDNPPQAQWHLQPAGAVADTYQTLSRIIRVEPKHFFSSFSKIDQKTKNREAYAAMWQQQEKKAKQYLDQLFAEAGFNEFAAVKKVLDHLPKEGKLHLANSMTVRYVNLLGLQPEQKVEVMANRGTSGIDGSNSTAMGSALCTSQLTTLITGDLAFFYDRNGLWHNYLPQNLRIVLLNNHAGGIFRIIEGPKQQPELEEFFETRQQLNAENTARDFNLSYTACRTLKEIETALPAFFDPAAPASLIEIFTDSPGNADFFKNFKQHSPFRCS